jgi:pimeloyl-ACP methyl ester carboxylesterase
LALLHHRVFGAGERVFVGLHGWNGSWDTFEPLVPYLPDDAQLISLDLPGYGDSPGLDTWTLDAVARAILETVEAAAPGKKFTLVGSCSGAVVGLYVGRHAGDRMQRFVILEPFAYVPIYLRILVFPIFGHLFYWSAFANPVGRWITNTILAGKRQDETDMMASFSRGSPWVPHRYLQLFDSIPGAHAFESLSMPKTMIVGEYTFEAVRDSVRIWSEVWGECEIERLPETGHLILDESPEAVSHLIFKHRPTIAGTTARGRLDEHLEASAASS